MDILQDREGRSNIRLIILVFVVLTGIVAALLYFPPIPTKTEPGKTSGEITFLDGTGNPFGCVLQTSVDGEPQQSQKNVNFIRWTNVPNIGIYCNAMDTKGVSVNFRISGDSRGRVILENYGINMPESVNISAPGNPLEYVEINASGVSFSEAEVSLQYTDAQLNGLNESRLVIYRYDNATQAWSELATTVDANNNILSTTVNLLSIFAVSTRAGQEIEVRDAKKVPVSSDIKTYDEAKILKKEAKKSSNFSTADIPQSGELEVDALASKNVAVKLKVNKADRGEIVLDDFGKNNPVSVPLPGRAVKYVEISASGISFSSANITIRYSDSELNGGNEYDLTIYHWNGASWEALPTHIDAVNKTLSAITTSLSYWGVATSVTIVANATGNIGFSGNLGGENVYSLSVPYSERPTGALSSANLNCMSDIGGCNVNVGGSNTKDQAVYVNFTYPNVQSVNWVRIWTRTYVNASDTTQMGLLNTTGFWVKLNSSTSTAAWVNLTYNVSSAANKTAYLKIDANNNLNFSLMFWTNGDTTSTDTYSDYFEATINYNWALAEISGYVTNKSSGAAISGATVTTNTSQTNITNASGFYTFIVGNGTYMINASFNGYVTNSTNVTVSGADRTNVNISLTPVVLSGYVKDKDSGLPLSGATVQTNTSNTTTTNAQGYYSFTGIRNGSYIVNASLTGYITNSTNVTISSVNVTNANISLSRPYLLSGYVTNKFIGAPLSGATVTTNTSQTNITNASGFYTFTVVNGTYIITASKAGYSDNSTNVTISGADSLNNNISLSPFTGRLIVFTDRQVYTDGAYNGQKKLPEVIGGEVAPYNLTVYAILLDDEGNIINSGITFQAYYNTTAILDHVNESETPANSTYANTHHTVKYGDLFNDTFSSFSETSNRGVFYSTHAPLNIPDTMYPDEHFMINITVKATYKSQMRIGNYTVMLTRLSCHNLPGNPADETETHASQHDNTPDTCAICHHGYEHMYENISEGIPGSFRASHFGKIVPTNPTTSSPQAATYFWNLSFSTTTTIYSAYTPSSYQWGTWAPGSQYCYDCHYDTTHGTYGGATSPDYIDMQSASGDRVSCSWSLSPSGATCHSATGIEGNSTASLVWNYIANSGGIPTIEQAVQSRSHNHSNVSKGMTCKLCHQDYHANVMPNATASRTSINEQCWLCHNISGGYLNITSNGGTNVNHTNPNCKACHLNNNLLLDSHLVPTAEYANASCTHCHDLGGKSPYHIDFNTFNKSDYVHNQYNLTENKRPLNFNASNGSAERPAENKICWGCHGDDPNNDGRANFSEQPASAHPLKYKNPRTCEECHQNASSTWQAPQNVAHSNNTNEVRTPGAPNCYDCHGQPANYNNSNQDFDYNNSWKATLAYHYGTGFPALKELRNTDGYCITYCHQNTSSPFKEEFLNEDNMQRPNHSAMTSRLDNQSCVADACHVAYELHSSDMRKPTLASGVFNNSACTVSGCHNVSDPPYIDYKFHNGGVNCTSCHMDNIGANIHPIKYLQETGDFAQVNITAADCNLCHKETTLDSELQKWGVSPKKVGSAHNSEDPNNGSKWNKTIDPYWDYRPHDITFVTGWKNNTGVDGKVRGFLTNFVAMQDSNYSAARISENTTADAYAGSHPPNHEFNSTVNSTGWVSKVVSGSDTTLEWDSAVGIPAGAITVATSDNNQATTVDTFWNASFTYPRSSAVAEATFRIDSKFLLATGISNGIVNVTISDNKTNRTWVYNRTLSSLDADWIEFNSNGELTIPNPDTVFWQNGPYNISLRTRYSAARSAKIKVAYDNVFLNISEVDYKKYNFTFYINNTAASDIYTLIVGYQIHTEPARLYVLNGTSFQYRANLSSGAFTKAIIPLSQQEYAGGNVTLRINDTIQGVDVDRDYIEIEYMFIESYRWINNSRVQYPCEYCHAPNMHFQHALGMPYEYKGSNYVGQEVNATTNWCASCHYQGYSSGTKDYNDMVQAFKNHSLAVPPEITGHELYGVNSSISPDYWNHSDLSSFNDSSCWSCHKGGLAEGSNSTVFIHSPPLPIGGVNCTNCHNIGGTASNVNFTAVNKSMHANLNKGANSTSQNTTNKPCWACHGTINTTSGLANESDQPVSSHNKTVYKNPRKCEACHNDTWSQFTAKNVTDHIPYGLSTSTDVNTSSYNNTYCSYCHNNSVGTSLDPDGLGLTGGSPRNASVSHYGANKTKLMLMNATSNSTDCNYCHKNSSNMLKWGILNGSLANISNKNGTAGTGTNHNSYTSSSQCPSCHGGFTVTPGFTFHNASLGNGSGGGPDCISCHDIGKTAQHRINSSAMNSSNAVHANLNVNATNSTGVPAANKKCWACHDSDGSQPSDMGDKYTNPYKCYDCHNATSKPYANVSSAPNVSEHFKGGAEIKAATGEVDNSSSCAICHNLTEMKVSYSEDDTYSTNFSLVSHYGRNRTFDPQVRQGASTNCSYCHQNASTAFSTAMLDPAYNRSISNHSLRYSSSNPNCTSSQCHSTGWIHNSTLTRTSITLPNSTFCLNCHGRNSTTGWINFTGAITSIKQKHNNTISCTECHLSSSRDIHPAKYLQSNTSYNTSNSTAVDCINCHQNLTVYPNLSRTPPKIPNPMYHSDNLSNGTLWNSTGYWTNNTITSCTYCHNDTKHNATALGRPAYWKGDNVVNSSITSASNWCAGCHYRGYSSGTKSYSDMTATFTTANLAVPPEITNGSYAPYNFSRYYNHSLTNYTDAACKLCHGINLTSGKMTAFVHNITWGSCTDCHYSFSAMNITTRPDRYVNSTMFNASPHRSVSCSNCHTKGHKNIGARKACEDCHAYQQSPLTDRNRHNITGAPGSSVVTNTDCTSCHNATLYNNAINNYGYNKTRDCDYCHTYPDKTYS